MACRCSSTLSHLLVTPCIPRPSVLPTTRRVPFSFSTPHRSTKTLTLRRRAGQHGTTVALPLGAAAVKCSSSSSSSRSPSSEAGEIVSAGSRSCIEAESTSEGQPGRGIIPCSKLVIKGCVLAFALSYAFNSKAALAVAENSLAASNLGIKVATFLRGFGWPDELVVLTVAMLPVLELRGAIPISYWLNVDPIKGYILAVLGNMAPVPLILLYLRKLSRFLGERSSSAKSFLAWLSERTRQKGGVIEEFEWLGLMLFVAVPFPGTGAWTGAFIAAILGMPFWEAMMANLFGVLLAGLLVNLVVTLGATYALVVGLLLFVISTFMWNVLRLVQKRNRDTT